MDNIIILARVNFELVGNTRQFNLELGNIPVRLFTRKFSKSDKY